MDTELLCPGCEAVLLYCKGDNGPDYLYCPVCPIDVVFDPDEDSALEIGVLT